MKRILLPDKEYADICLNCPKAECNMDWWGECERTKPYSQFNKHKYATKEDEEIECTMQNLRKKRMRIIS